MFLTLLFEKLPTILVLAVLVGIFLSLRKHSSSARIRLWIFAWALIFVHFLVQVFETRTGVMEQLLEAIDLGALEISGVVFLVSLTSAAEDRLRRFLLLGILGLPVAFHAGAITFNWDRQATLAALGLAFFGGAAVSLFLPRKPTLFHAGLAALMGGAGSWAIYHQFRGDSDPAVIAILALTFGISGALFWKRFPRISPGVITVVGGFLCWGAVFPVAALLDHLHPNLHVNPELWNVPKFFVAFGMILSLLEDKSRIIEEVSDREHAENALLQRFARITSQLLTGRNPAALCNEIAEAITETSSFRQAAIFLAGEDNSLRLAGSSGFPPTQSDALRERAARWNLNLIGEFCARGQRLGNNSFRIRSEESSEQSEWRARQGSGAEATWKEGDEAIVPMISSRGTCLGYLMLAAPRKAGLEDPSAMAKLEMLAADLAVTLENTRLHHQLVRSEKLAALGQLVAGVAHELNNPLTGIIGYTDLLTEEAEDERALKRLTKLGHEARRMERIVDGLLRFARQNNPATRATNLETALRDSIQLREYHLRRLSIDIRVELDPLLPELSIGEDELKQILLNLLNNAVDAVEESEEKSVRIRAARQGNRVAICFEDTGCGFADLERACDPFYTTKPVGKGTGLGLSICYGIVRECGGEIHLSNRTPFGASVLVEIPVAQPAVSFAPA